MKTLQDIPNNDLENTSDKNFENQSIPDQTDLQAKIEPNPEIDSEQKITAKQAVEEILEKITIVKPVDLEETNKEENIVPDESKMAIKDKKFYYSIILPILSYLIFPIAYFLKPSENNQKLKKEVTSIFAIFVLGRILDLIQLTLGISALDISLLVTLVVFGYSVYGIYNIISNNQFVTPLYNISVKVINELKAVDKAKDLQKKLNDNLKMDKKIFATLVFLFFCIISLLTTVQMSYYYTVRAISNGNATEFKSFANYTKIHENSNSFKIIDKVDYDDYIDNYIESSLPKIVEFELNQIKNNPFLLINNDKILIEREGATYSVKHTIDKYRYSYNYNFNGVRWVITNFKMIF